MKRDATTYIWHAVEAAELVADFIAGKRMDDDLEDRMLRSAVERDNAVQMLPTRMPSLAQRIAMAGNEGIRLHPGHRGAILDR